MPIVKPNPKIAATNFDFDFIETSPLLARDTTLPERMQAECQCRATGTISINCIVFSKLGVDWTAWKKGIREVPVARFHQYGGFRPAGPIQVRMDRVRSCFSRLQVCWTEFSKRIRETGKYLTTPRPSAVCQDWRLAGLEQLFIGSDQSQPEHPRRGHQKSVGGIAMRQLHAGRFLRDLISNRSFPQGNYAQRICDPRLRIRMQCQPVFLAKRQDLPQRDGRKPQLVPRILQRGSQPGGKSRSIERAPYPNVSVKQQLHPRNASQSSSSLARETMSPLICPVP